MPVSALPVAAASPRIRPVRSLPQAARGVAVLGFALAVVAAAATPSPAVDKYAGAFLHVGAGARAVGMGGAFAALADDASAAYWNPAGLTQLALRQVLYQHSEQFGGAVNYDYGALAWPLADSTQALRQAVAVSLVRLGVGDIAVTPDPDGLRPGVDFEDGDGDPSTNLPTENNGRWDAGERLYLDASSFDMKSANDWALFLSYARPFGGRLSAGASLKAVYRTLPGYGAGHSAWGAGLDAGLTYAVRPELQLAFVAHDLTTTYMSWDTGTREHVSPSFDLGGRYSARLAAKHALTLAAHMPFNFDGYTPDQYFGIAADLGADGEPRTGFSGTINAGVEYWYDELFALRTGMMGRDLTFGAGVRYKKIGADYAAVFNRVFGTDVPGFSGNSNLDVTHRVSGSYNF
jgi:hypothetical protein